MNTYNPGSKDYGENKEKLGLLISEVGRIGEGKVEWGEGK